MTRLVSVVPELVMPFVIRHSSFVIPSPIAEHQSRPAPPLLTRRLTVGFEPVAPEPVVVFLDDQVDGVPTIQPAA